MVQEVGGLAGLGGGTQNPKGFCPNFCFAQKLLLIAMLKRICRQRKTCLSAIARKATAENRPLVVERFSFTTGHAFRSSSRRGGRKGGLGGIPPAEPKEFRSDIFKQTPPSLFFGFF